MFTRLNNPAIDLRIIIGQRLHEDDVTGHVLAAHYGNSYKHICLPAEETTDVHPAELKKYYKGGLLFPERLSRKYLDEAKATMQPYSYEGQMNQRPSPAEGGIFKKVWWKFWKPQGAPLPAITTKIGDVVHTHELIDLPTSFDDMLCSWDMAFKDMEENDYVVGQVWATAGGRRFLIDQMRRRMDYPESEAAVLEMMRKYPRASGVLIEDKANGPAIIASLKRFVPGLVPVNPRGTKFARAQPLAKQCMAGSIYLPHPVIAPWVMEFIENFAKFPKGTHDDEIDTASQAIDHLASVPKVWPMYRGEQLDYGIDFKNLSEDTTLLCSQWVQKDLSTVFLLATWNRRKHQLAVFDELLLPSTRPDIVGKVLADKVRKVSEGVLSNIKPFEWYANDLMFGKGGIETDLFNAYAKYRLYPQQNPMYNESGSIEAINRLLFRSRPEVEAKNRALLIHSRLAELPRQMKGWDMANGKPAEGYPMAMALCNVVSILYETGRMKHEAQPPKPYSRQTAEIYQKLKRFADTGDFAGIERMNRGRSGQGKLPRSSGNSWMI